MAPSAVEYGLLLTGVAALIVAVVFLFGGAVSGLSTKTCDSVGAGSAGSMTCEVTSVAVGPQTPALPRAQQWMQSGSSAGARDILAPAHRGVASRLCTAPGP